MAHDPEPTSFAAVLRRCRLAAGLTQEALAERAGMSARGIQNLEGGVSRPYQESARRLAAALGQTGADAANFLAAAQPAQRRVRTAGGEPGRRVAHNLPVQLTTFVGRERELAELTALLERSRLVTLTGTGGVGKTRLALHAATGLLEGYPDGVWLVELAPLADPTLAPAAVAGVVGVREQPGQPLLGRLVTALRAKRLLLLLDNCEHLLDACAQLAAALLRGCPELRLLATSRQALGMAGETSIRVPSLTLPAADQPLTPDVLASSEAVQLFRDRATAARPDFALTEHNVAAVADLCRRLDGIPLALELAAARARALSAQQLVKHLDERFLLLADGNRTALPRQQTLRATLDWSHELLTEPEQRLFRRLAVFAGGWTLEAAEAVCSGEGIGRAAVLDLLARLVERSLVQAEEQESGSPRYQLLETVRHYARQRLDESGEAADRCGRHADCFRALANEAALHLRGPRQGDWRRRLEPELDNFRAALRWWLERGDAERGLQMAGSLFGFWERDALEGLGWLTALLSLPDPAPPLLRGRSLFLAAVATNAQGDLVGAATLAREALATFRTIGERTDEARALSGLAMFTLYQGDYAEAVCLYEECLAHWRQLDDAVEAAFPLSWFGRALVYGGDVARARPCLDEAMTALRRAGDFRRLAMATEFRGEAAEAEGDDAAARTDYTAAQVLYLEVIDQGGIASTHTFLGRLALKGGDRHEAKQRFRQGLAVANAVGLRVRLCDALEGLAALATEERRSERALRLAGAALALRGTGVASPMQRVVTAPRLERARQLLGEGAAAAAWAEGQALALEEAVVQALEEGGAG